MSPELIWLNMAIGANVMLDEILAMIVVVVVVVVVV